MIYFSRMCVVVSLSSETFLKIFWFHFLCVHENIPFKKYWTFCEYSSFSINNDLEIKIVIRYHLRASNPKHFHSRHAILMCNKQVSLKWRKISCLTGERDDVTNKHSQSKLLNPFCIHFIQEVYWLDCHIQTFAQLITTVSQRHWARS